MIPKTPESASNPAREIPLGDMISEAASIESLYTVLETLGTIKGSEGTEYNTKDIIDTIKTIREIMQAPHLNPDVEKSPFIRRITRSWGLREKVIELLRKEQQEQKD
ncbi:MAG: hypothetical protein AAB617_02825 [Patescibacteria group bacterium]